MPMRGPRHEGISLYALPSITGMSNLSFAFDTLSTNYANSQAVQVICLILYILGHIECLKK